MSILDNMKGDGKLQKEKELAVKQSTLDKRIDVVMRSYEGWLEHPYTLTIEFYTLCERPVGSRADISLIDEFGCKELWNSTVDQAVIDGFCFRLKDYQSAEGFKTSGLFLSAMIQNAYRHGHNGLRINTQNLEKNIDLVGAGVFGTEDNPIRVVVDGVAGDNCGYYTKHSHFKFNGNVGKGCGCETKHSHFTFLADVDDYCGYKAEHSELTFRGDVGDRCGAMAEHSKIYSPRKDVLKQIKKDAYPYGFCSFYLLNPDGTSTPYGLTTKLRDYIARGSR